MTVRSVVAGEVNDLEHALSSDTAFETWYRRTLPRVYSYLMSRGGGDTSLAEELTQQTFAAAIGQRSRFDGRSDTVTWLCAIARNKLADHFRRIEREERRQRRMEVRWIQAEDGAMQTSDLDERTVIAETLRALPAAQRAVLTFVVLDDLPVADAAKLLGKSRGATESLLFRARDNFRRVYEGSDR